LPCVLNDKKRLQNEAFLFSESHVPTAELRATCQSCQDSWYERHQTQSHITLPHEINMHRPRNIDLVFTWMWKMFFRSFRSLYYDRSTANTNRAFQTVRNIPSSFKFEPHSLSLRPSSSCLCRLHSLIIYYTGCPTRYRSRHFFNNFTTNEDIATKFEVDLPYCIRNVTTS
jgi:hypothetical protein